MHGSAGEHDGADTFEVQKTCEVGLPGGSDGKASAYDVGDPGSSPGSGRSPGEGNGNPLQYPCLENPMDGSRLLHPWCCKESDMTDRLHFHFHTCEQGMPGERVWKLESCAWGTDYVKVNSLGFHLKERGTCCKKKKKKRKGHKASLLVTSVALVSLSENREDGLG